MSTAAPSPKLPGGGARRRPPPPKPQPYKSTAPPQDTSLRAQETSSRSQETSSRFQETSRSPETPPRELAVSHSSGSISPSVMARIDHRPRMDSPVLDRSLSPSLPPLLPPHPSSPSSHHPSSSPQLSSKHALRFSPPPLPPPYHLDEEEERAMVVSQALPSGPSTRGSNYNYSEVTIKTLVPVKNLEHVPFTPPTAHTNDEDAYDVTSHVAPPITKHSTVDPEYSSLSTPPQRVYDSIDIEEKDANHKPHPSSPLHKSVNQQRARSSSPKPPLAPKPLVASPKLSSRQPPPKPPRPSCSTESPSPTGRRKPQVLPKPDISGRGSPSLSSPLVASKSFSFDDEEGEEGTKERKEIGGGSGRRKVFEKVKKDEEKGSRNDEGSGRQKVFEKDKEELQGKQENDRTAIVGKNEQEGERRKVFEKESNISQNTSSEASHVCEVDIDALISRKKQEQPSSAEQTEAPPTQKTRPRQQHIYDDVNELLIKPSSNHSTLEGPPRIITSNGNSPGLTRSGEQEGKRPKEPPKRRPPPPPVTKGSPPVQRKPLPPGTESKSLTLGRSPRSNIELGSPSNEPSPRLLTKKVTPAIGSSPSPGIKSKFKTFFRAGSRDDSFTGGRGSFKKRKGSSHVITSPVEGAETGGRVSKTLPSRPRGKSVDPYMDSGVPSTYSIITMGTEVRIHIHVVLCTCVFKIRYMYVTPTCTCTI